MSHNMSQGVDAPFSVATGSINLSIQIRPMLSGDLTWVEAQQARVFGPGRFARAAFRVREQHDADLSLCAVAELDGLPIGSVIMTPISIGAIDGTLLGPLAVDDVARNMGAGRLLVSHVSNLSNSREGNQFVLLVGDRDYYQPLGFLPTTLQAVKFPAPVDAARILANCCDVQLTSELRGPILAAHSI